uniref:Uncharacterized protein n=1 Tax=Kuenenia stuttgartiensis TaxID=174633 RepID=Q1Q0Y7_KUEST|nr:unknown protein [Candidatus Kuenenia stuttgartiensis]
MGRMKTLQSSFKPLCFKQFQFLIGRMKTCISTYVILCKDYVSIPHR